MSNIRSMKRIDKGKERRRGDTSKMIDTCLRDLWIHAHETSMDVLLVLQTSLSLSHDFQREEGNDDEDQRRVSINPSLVRELTRFSVEQEGMDQ